jgi:aminoglycoside/choline kinase family phosphotransferase
MMHTARGQLPIPASPEALTPQWLGASLRNGGVDVDVAEAWIETIGEGAGMMSRLVRARLQYLRGHGPSSVIVKLATPSTDNLATAEAFHLYRREVGFYRAVASSIDIRLPRIYYGAIRGEAPFVLVMEDLVDYENGDQVVGATPDQALQAVTALAGIHAPFWDDVDRGELDFIPYHYPSYHSQALQRGACAGWDVVAALAGDAMPEGLRSQRDRFVNAIPRMQAWITDTPRTIAHGDYRMDNLFFSREPGHSSVAAVDWQGVLRCKGIHDLAKFLSQSLGTETRRDHERQLVAQWHASLGRAGVTGYPLEAAWEDYRRAVLYLWTYVAVVGGTLDSHNARGRRWMLEMIHRGATAIEDLEVLPVLTEFE